MCTLVLHVILLYVYAIRFFYRQIEINYYYIIAFSPKFVACTIKKLESPVLDIFRALGLGS